MLFRVFFITVLFLSAITSVSADAISEDVRQKIFKHCGQMQAYGETFARSRATGMEKKEAWEESTLSVAKRFGIPMSEKLKTVTGVYSIYIDMFNEREPMTLGLFVLAQCITTHAVKKSLPLNTPEGREQINAVLEECETTHPKNRDERGGCVLDNLRPLVTTL